MQSGLDNSVVFLLSLLICVHYILVLKENVLILSKGT